jgi:phosphoglycerate dehydrogenase-like enzyme
VIVTPHASAFTRLAVEQTGDAVVASLRALLEGRLPDGCLDRRAWDAH